MFFYHHEQTMHLFNEKAYIYWHMYKCDICVNKSPTHPHTHTTHIDINRKIFESKKYDLNNMEWSEKIITLLIWLLIMINNIVWYMKNEQ